MGRGEIIKKWLKGGGFGGECFMCEVRVGDDGLGWKDNKVFVVVGEEYGGGFGGMVDCYRSGGR